MNVLEAIKSRRSHFTKEFTGGSIPKEIIKVLLEMAHCAPSHYSTLPWRFKVFSGKGLHGISAKMAEVYKNETPSEKFKPEKADKIKAYPDKVSHIIAIVMKRDGEKRLPETEEICAVACAVENMYIALTTFEGVGGYWTTGNGTYSQEMKTWLNLDAEDRLMGYFFLGNVDSKRTESSRGSFENYVEWHED